MLKEVMEEREVRIRQHHDTNPCLCKMPHSTSTTEEECDIAFLLSMVSELKSWVSKPNPPEKVKKVDPAWRQGFIKKVKERREALDLVLTQKNGFHPELPDNLALIEKQSKDIPCPVCKSTPPACDCGCGEGYDCCDFDSRLEPPCLGCGYQGRVLRAPDEVSRDVLLKLNEDPYRGMPNDEYAWPKMKFWIPEEVVVEPPKEDPAQLKIPI